MMTDKEFDKLLEDDSQSDGEVGRRRRKRKVRDMVCILFCCWFMDQILSIVGVI